MPRDPRKLRVFNLADSLVPDVYRATADFPDDERFGIVRQIRRAAVSVPTNIVEGCARRTTTDYLNLLNIATGSAYELNYLFGLSVRLHMVSEKVAAGLLDRCGHVAASLTALVDALEPEARAETGRKPRPVRPNKAD